MSKKELIKELRNFADKLSRNFVIENIILFGSRAKGKPNNNSDIDLIIVSDDFKGMNAIRRASKMYDYWTLNIPVDFLCFTREEFERLRKRISIVQIALEEGIII